MHRSPATGPDRLPAEGDVARAFQHAGHRLLVAGGTRVGHHYPTNFDVLHVDPRLPFLAVADGMGGGRGSAVAGSTTMETIVAAVRAAAPDVGPDTLRAAVAEAQARVRAAGAELAELTGCTFTGLIAVPAAAERLDGPTRRDGAGPGPRSLPGGASAAPRTTGSASRGRGPLAPGADTGSPAALLARGSALTRATPLARSAPPVGWAAPAARSAPDASAAVGSDPDSGGPDHTAASAWIVQIGDSRAYRLRDGLLELLTVDHTAAWLGAVYGWYPADSPAAATARYQLTRYVGHPGAPEPDLLHVSLRPGDVYCLCTDGVAEQLDYQRLADRLGAATSPVETVRRVLADTLVAGGRDNATIAVLRVEHR